MHDLVRDFKPAVVVVDPITNLSIADGGRTLQLTLMRLVDFLKQQQITALFTNLSHDVGLNLANSEVGISSLMDTWLMMSNFERNGERTRTLQIVKSRGMPHSNRVREFVISSKGVGLIDVFVVDGDVVTGGARLTRLAQAEQAAERLRAEQAQRERRVKAKHQAIEAQIAALQAELEEARIGDAGPRHAARATPADRAERGAGTAG
jgi:circadian clock protein KaiC